MNSKQRKTLEKIFQDPVRSDIAWADIESLFQALGVLLSGRAGSRVAANLQNAVAVFHRPHPERVADKGVVMGVRKFLIKAGVKWHDEVQRVRGKG